MRKSKPGLYSSIFYALVAIGCVLSFTIFRAESAVLKSAYWDNFWFGIFIGTIIQGLTVVSYGLWAYEEGRKKGIKEMSNELLVDPDDYYDHKHPLGNKKKAPEELGEALDTSDNTTKAEIKPNNVGAHHSSACGCRYCE